MKPGPLTLQQVNNFDKATFVEALGFLFEGSPWIVAEGWRDRPFADLDALHRSLCEVMYNAGEDRKVALIRAHPDLVGKAALAGAITPESTKEQASAGLDRLTQEEVTTFTRLNRAYREKFAFPFVICARENKKESILAGFASRIDNTREQEIGIALAEVAKIARLRLRDAVVDEPRP